MKRKNLASILIVIFIAVLIMGGLVWWGFVKPEPFLQAGSPSCDEVLDQQGNILGCGKPEYCIGGCKPVYKEGELFGCSPCKYPYEQTDY